MSLARQFRRVEAGFTFVEVMVSLLLVSVLVLVLVSALVGAQRLIGGAGETAVGAARLLELDEALRKAALRVRTPFWEAPEAVVVADGRIEVPWLDGFAERSLVVERRGDRLALLFVGGGPGEGARALVLGPFREIGVGTFADERGVPLGIRVTVGGSSLGAELVEILARFGGRPFPPPEGP